MTKITKGAPFKEIKKEKAFKMLFTDDQKEIFKNYSEKMGVSLAAFLTIAGNEYIKNHK